MKDPQSRLRGILLLVAQGILGTEDAVDVLEPVYRSWPVLQESKLPKAFAEDLLRYGEVRFYLVDRLA